MSGEPAVSVVMGVFNGKRFLQSAVESILGQSFTDFEFIVIDDGSSDSSLPCLQEYARRDERMRVFSQPNRGISAAANRGCSLARGKYIARMDCDDISHSERFAKQIECLESHPETALVGSDVECIDDQGHVLEREVAPHDHEAIVNALATYNCFSQSVVMMRKAAFDCVGGYRSMLRNQAEDFDLWLRLSEKFEVANLPLILSQRRWHGDQLSIRGVVDQRLASLAVMKAAERRRAGQADPLDGAGDPSVELLTQMGMPAAQVWREVVGALRHLALTMSRFGKSASAHRLLEEAIRIGLSQRGARKETSQALWEQARLFFREGRLAPGISAAVHASFLRPWLPYQALSRRLQRPGRNS